MYDYALGRFTGRDSVGYVDGWNVYTYALLSPTIRTDSVGSWSKKADKSTKKKIVHPVDPDGPVRTWEFTFNDYREWWRTRYWIYPTAPIVVDETTIFQHDLLNTMEHGCIGIASAIMGTIYAHHENCFETFPEAEKLARDPKFCGGDGAIFSVHRSLTTE